MRAWAIVLAVAVLQCNADSENLHRKSRTVGSFVETIGAADLAVKENGKARFTFWEKTSPNLHKPKVSCGLKTNVPGNYTLEIVRPDQSKEILLLSVESTKGVTEGFFRAYFPVNVANIRPCEIHIRLLQGAADEDGLLLGTVQITPRAVSRTKRDDAAARQVIKKVSQILRRNKNKKKKANDKLNVYEFTTSSEALQENVPIMRQAAEVQENLQNKKPDAKKNKKDKGKKKTNRGRKMQKRKEAERQQKQMDKEKKQQGLPADILRQKLSLRASGEAFANPIQIDFVKQRIPKSVHQTHRVKANPHLQVNNENEEIEKKN